MLPQFPISLLLLPDAPTVISFRHNYLYPYIHDLPYHRFYAISLRRVAFWLILYLVSRRIDDSSRCLAGCFREGASSLAILIAPSRAAALFIYWLFTRHRAALNARFYCC